MQGVDVDMDINVFRAVVLITLMISFVGLWVWAWNSKRKPAFHEASMLPLEEDHVEIPNDEARMTGKGADHVN